MVDLLRMKRAFNRNRSFPRAVHLVSTALFPIKVGNLRVAHPLKGIRSQRRPAPRGAIENEPVLRIELLPLERAGRIGQEFNIPLGTCIAFERAPSKRRSSSSRTSM